MGEPILVLRLEGPLQSWGERARWDIRDSLREPTKSGVVGLLGAALGIPRAQRDALKMLDRQLRMAVRVEREGSALDDFHTVMGMLPTAEGKRRDTTIISKRRYLEDAAFLVLLASDPPDGGTLAEQCARALQAPQWPLFLGRRSCPPTRPVFVEVTRAYGSLEEAVAAYPWSCLDACAAARAGAPGVPLRVVVEDGEGGTARQDRLEVNEIRIYGERRVREAVVPLPTAGGHT